MKNGIRFFNVVWETPMGAYENTTESAHSRRYLADQIRKKDVAYFDDFGTEWKLIKIQEIETPVIEIEWLLNLFTTSGKKSDRESHKEQAAYVLRLVENCAARVILENGDIVER